MLDLPANVKAAAKGGFVAWQLARVDLPEAQGGTQRWCDAGRAVTYDGEVWLPSDEYFAVTMPDKGSERGHRVLQIGDGNAVYYKRFKAAGVAGIPVRFATVMRLGPQEGYPLWTYKGVTSSADHQSPKGHPVLAVGTVGRFVKLDSQPRVSTGKAAQRAVDPTDTSMDSAAVALRAVRHK